jgi:hypothetical protein
MTSILRQLPFQQQADEVSFGLERIAAKPYQIILWVSVTKASVVQLPPHAPRFPAILDTGHSHNFSIHERHLAEWASVSAHQLSKRGHTTIQHERVPLHDATVWIHPNEPGKRDEFADQPPYRFDFLEGITLSPGSAHPRLPLLGLRALVRNKLHFALNSERCAVNLQAPDWRTKLSWWLS